MIGLVGSLQCQIVTILSLHSLAIYAVHTHALSHAACYANDVMGLDFGCFIGGLSFILVVI